MTYEVQVVYLVLISRVRGCGTVIYKRNIHLDFVSDTEVLKIFRIF